MFTDPTGSTTVTPPLREWRLMSIFIDAKPLRGIVQYTLNENRVSKGVPGQ
jgi:hypothetical protein